MYSTNIDEKSNIANFISVGIKSYEISEKIVSDDHTLNGKRKYTVEVQINFYSRYSRGVDQCYRLFVEASKALLASEIKNKIKYYKCFDAAYKRSVDSITMESVLKLEDIYT